MPNIKIVGSTKTHPLEEVQSIVTRIAGKYYWKDDTERVIQVNRPKGMRYARRTSKKLVKLMFEGYGYLEDCVMAAYAAKNQTPYLLAHLESTVELSNGKYEHSEYVGLLHTGERVSLREPRADGQQYVRLYNNSSLTRSYGIADECCELSRDFYGSGKWALQDNCVPLPEGNCLATEVVNAVTSITTREGRVDSLNYTGTHKSLTMPVMIDAVSNTPSLVPFHHAFINSTRRIVLVEPPLGGSGARSMRVLLNPPLSEAKGNRIRNYFAIPTSTEDVKLALSSAFSDMDITENVADTIDLKAGRRPGKERVGGTRGNLEISPTRYLVGGLKYTYGIEIETSAGIIPNSILNTLGIEAVGDGSIGSAEYVTPPLHGDIGVGKLNNLMRQIREYTLVDDRCAIHIHIGGVNPKEYGTSTTEIKFDYKFAIKLISLCAHIESDIFSILPANRSPFFRHCHSILRWRGINKDNWRPMLGSYVFGPEEKWGTPTNPFNYNMFNYEYGKGNYSKDSSTGTRWPSGRYKWLNLTNAYSRSNFSTVEFRVFSGTTNPHKVYCYLLISLAIVKYAESIMKIGDELPTLSQLIEAVYPDKNIRSVLDNFISKRKASFNRSDVYGGLLPPEPILQEIISK